MDILNGLYNADMKKFADPYQNGVERFDKLSECVQKVIKGLGDNTSSALDIAKSLYNIKTFEMYKGYPVAGSNGCTVYSTFEQFCSDFFKAKKSTIYNYLSIYEKFGSDSELRPKAIPSNFAKNYTYSQLLLMSSLSDTELLKVQPDWTCKKIKEYVKENSILNSKRLEKVEEEDLVIEEKVRYQSYKLDTPEHCEEFLRTYQRWDKIADFSIGIVSVLFYKIELRNFTVVAYASTLSGNWDVLYYVYNHTLNYFEGVKDHFSVVNKMNVFGAAALLSTLPVEFADIETSVYPGKSRENK